MKNLYRYFRMALAIILVGVFSGCLARSYTVEKPRTDLEITGNQGYLEGKAQSSAPKKTNLRKTRTISVLEIEFGPKSKSGKEEITEENIQEQTIEVTTPKKETEETASSQKETEEATVQEAEIVIQQPKKEEPPKPTVNYRYYIIQKNDTLQKISKKFYGTTKKWLLIYKNNKDIIKDYNKLYPGLKIKIPILH